MGKMNFMDELVLFYTLKKIRLKTNPIKIKNENKPC
jgi:hypothetical protein